MVDAVRLPRWVDGFASRHGEPVVVMPQSGSTQAGSPQSGALLLRAPDGATALMHAPFACDQAGAEPPADIDALVSQVLAERVVAVLLLRRGGYGCAVVCGDKITASKVGTRYVQGKTAAGGWSQHRFARRRANQTDEIIGVAADTVVRVVLPGAPVRLATGGDRALVERVLADPRLRRLAELPRGPHLVVGDPRMDVVRAVPAMLRQVRIVVTDPV